VGAALTAGSSTDCATSVAGPKEASPRYDLGGDKAPRARRRDDWREWPVRPRQQKVLASYEFVLQRATHAHFNRAQYIKLQARARMAPASARGWAATERLEDVSNGAARPDGSRVASIVRRRCQRD